MKFLQKLGKALMLPVACLPICGILMGIGYALCPATMQGGEVTGIIQQIGYYLVKAGGALIDNMAILFAIGVGVGMSDENDGTGGLAALVSWLMITNLLSTCFLQQMFLSSELCQRMLHLHSIKSRTRSSVSSQVSSELCATTDSRAQNFRTGCHSSAANAVLLS